MGVGWVGLHCSGDVCEIVLRVWWSHEMVVIVCDKDGLFTFCLYVDMPI